jgi:hypothetical protein
MFEKKNTEKEKDTPPAALEIIKKEITKEEPTPNDKENSGEGEIQSRKKASTFSQKLNMFNRNAVDSTRLVKKDLEKKDLRIYKYDNVIEEKNKKDKLTSSADYEAQLTSRQKYPEVEDKTEKEIKAVDESKNKQYVKSEEDSNTDLQNETIHNQTEKIEEEETEEIDDVYDDIYISRNDINQEKEDESKTVEVEIVTEIEKNDGFIKNQKFDYRQLNNSQDVSMNCDTVINISNLSINQNNYNPIFNSYTTDDRKENDIAFSHDSLREEVMTDKKDLRSLMMENFMRYKYLYLIGLVIIIIIFYLVM